MKKFLFSFLFMLFMGFASANINVTNNHISTGNTALLKLKDNTISELFIIDDSNISQDNKSIAEKGAGVGCYAVGKAVEAGARGLGASKSAAKIAGLAAVAICDFLFILKHMKRNLLVLILLFMISNLNSQKKN